MSGLAVGIVGCGLMGRKRAAALGPDRAVAVCDADPGRAEVLAAETGARAVADVDAVLAARPDVVIVATTHDALADTACRALAGGAHVLVEKPAGRTVEEADRIADAAAAAGRRVKVGFNHRFHPGIMRAISEARAGEHGEVMYMRARYGHGGRAGLRPRVAGRAGGLGRRRAARPGHAPARPQPLAHGPAAAALGAAAHELLGHAGRGQRRPDAGRAGPGAAPSRPST